jgi:hypothetical protein
MRVNPLNSSATQGTDANANANANVRAKAKAKAKGGAGKAGKGEADGEKEGEDKESTEASGDHGAEAEVGRKPKRRRSAGNANKAPKATKTATGESAPAHSAIGVNGLLSRSSAIADNGASTSFTITAGSPMSGDGAKMFESPGREKVGDWEEKGLDEKDGSGSGGLDGTGGAGTSPSASSSKAKGKLKANVSAKEVDPQVGYAHSAYVPQPPPSSQQPQHSPPRRYDGYEQVTRSTSCVS